MSHPTLRDNLVTLNDLLTTEDRRDLLRELGMGGTEMVRYLAGERSPTDGRLTQLKAYFGIEANLRHKTLDGPLLNLIRTQLARRRRARKQLTPRPRALVDAV